MKKMKEERVLKEVKIMKMRRRILGRANGTHGKEKAAR